MKRIFAASATGATAALVSLGLLALPSAAIASGPPATASAAKNARALTKNCTPIAKVVKKKSGSAKREAKRKLKDCKKQNQARTIVAKQISGYGFVGARGDGEAVDWRQCANGRYLHYTEQVFQQLCHLFIQC